MDHGVPMDTAFALDNTWLLAFMVVFGEMNSTSQWDWGAMRWVEKKEG